MSSRKILIFENFYTLTNFMCKQWIEYAEQCIAKRGKFIVCLSGGKTPIEFFTKLSDLELDDIWKDTYIFLTDERFVGLDDRASNFRMIRDNLLNFINIPDENVFPMNTEMEDFAQTAEHYEDTLKQFFQLSGNELPRFDLMLLGVGADGHVASLFPHTLALDVKHHLVVPVQTDHLEQKRITVTFPVINHSRKIFLFARGSAKAEVVNQIIEKETQLPISRVFPTDGELIFLFDAKAATKLTYTSFTDAGEAISI